MKTMYVLVEKAAERRLGYPIYFQQMVAIGPMTTPKLEEAAVFTSEQAAMECPAWTFLFTCFAIEKMPFKEPVS